VGLDARPEILEVLRQDEQVVPDPDLVADVAVAAARAVVPAVVAVVVTRRRSGPPPPSWAAWSRLV